jgi:hypothetical protein
VTPETTIGAASLMGGLITAVAMARWAVSPRRTRGRHRAGDRFVPLGELLPAWPQPARGAVVAQAFRHCPPCGRVVAVVLHQGGAQHCDNNHLTNPHTVRGDQ